LTILGGQYAVLIFFEVSDCMCTVLRVAAGVQSGSPLRLLLGMLAHGQIRGAVVLRSLAHVGVLVTCFPAVGSFGRALQFTLVCR